MGQVSRVCSLDHIVRNGRSGRLTAQNVWALNMNDSATRSIPGKQQKQ
jgi:hypothetical protein